MLFSNDTVERFADASRDFNPLHTSDVRARVTPFGRRVAHGACGVLASCGLFTPPPGCFPSALRVLFYQPPFLDLDYEPRIISISPQRTMVKLMDGSSEVMEITFEFLPGTPVLLATLPGDPVAPRHTARALSETDLAPGLAYEGCYSPCTSSYEALLREFGVVRQAWGDALPIALMASSYLTGMEMPGERALYFQLNAVFSNVSFELPTAFRLELTDRDRRGMVKSQFRFSSGDSVWSLGDMRALLLPPRAGIAPLAGPIPPEMADRFGGKVALIVGGSRGFGSCLALTLAAAGATVIVLYARSSEDAAQLQAAAAALPGQILPRQCDATDPAACCEVRQEVLARHGRLDWLVCSGVPPLQNLRVETAAFERIERFLMDGFALVLAPLSSFIDLLSQSSGSVLLISSSAVEDPPPVWPHYVALKCADEGLGRTTAAGYPKVSFCIARPTKLLTDLVNTPMGRANAENPCVAALRILSAAATQLQPGQVYYVR